MKADKKTLLAIKRFLECREGWTLNDLMYDMVAETNLLRHKEMGKYTLSIDECGITWGEDYICELDEFVKIYSEIIIQRFCNVLDSFIDEELFEYEDD